MTPMQFDIERCEALNITDAEIFDLLTEVYVQADYTTAERAAVVFDPALVRQRGTMFAARETSSQAFAGMIIIVPPSSAACVLAGPNECEIHLLSVSPAFRGHGLGSALITKAISYAEAYDWSKIILWT